MIPLAELLMALPPSTLDALAAVVGPVPGLAPKASPSETARALFLHSASFQAPIHVVSDISEMFDPQAAAAVFSILPRIATEIGQLGVMELAHALGDARVAEWRGMSPAEVAAALAMEIATTIDVAGKEAEYERAAALVNAARRRIDEEPIERPTYELLTRSRLPLDPKRLLATLRRGLGKALAAAWPAPEWNGALQLALFVRRPVEARAFLNPSGRVSRRTFTPVTVDQLRVFADGTRVALTLADPAMLPLYARALRLSLDPSVTLRSLHPSTIDELLRRAPPGVEVEIVGLGFRAPDGAEYDVDGPGAWEAAARVWKTETETLYRASLRIRDAHRRRVTVRLEAPHRIEIPERMVYEPARAALAALGLLVPFREKGIARGARAPRVAGRSASRRGAVLH
jgi:hypothetical protein